MPCLPSGNGIPADTCLLRQTGLIHPQRISAGPDHRTDRDGSPAYYLSEKQIDDNEPFEPKPENLKFRRSVDRKGVVFHPTPIPMNRSQW